MKLFFLIYFLGMLTVVGGFLPLNKKYKWITKKDVRTDNDGTLVISLVFWPITLVLVAICAICHFIYVNFIPDDK